jgi:tRNA threonylcarbamoyladenosine biosynthesis protein TsaE
MSDSGEVFRKVSESDLATVVKAIVTRLNQVPVWIFHGDLGSGKTTLIKAIGEAIGVDDAMSSPTFAIVNEYHSHQFGRVYHFDCYRLKSEIEAMDLGFEEYFLSGYPCFVEWPEKIPSLLPENRGEVTLAFEDHTTRTIAISVHAG